MNLVVDANVVLSVAAASRVPPPLRDVEPVAPPLLWPEVRSVLHAAKWRGIIEPDDAAATLEKFESGLVTERRHRHLGRESWRIAEALGWAKTYDSEYLALASLLRVPIASFDRRLTRGAERMGIETYSFA